MDPAKPSPHLLPNPDLANLFFSFFFLASPLARQAKPKSLSMPRRRLKLRCLLLAACPGLAQLQVEQVQPPAIVNNIGRMGLAGQYSGISQYTYVGQQAQTDTTPYFDSIISQLDSDEFIHHGKTDGRVTDRCQINEMVYLTGNFTKVGSTSTPGGLLAFNASSGEFSPIARNFNGEISTLYCDTSNNTIYAGGNFTFQNASGVAVFTPGDNSWSLPGFGGFATGAHVNSITYFNENIIFGGQFNGLSNESYTKLDTTTNSTTNVTTQDPQRVSFHAADVFGGGSLEGSDPRNIVCPSDTSIWRMHQGSVGSWNALWPYSFNPTRIRIYNLREAGAGVSTFRLLSFPSNGIMNLTFTNSSRPEPYYCDAWCSLPMSSDQEYVDFEFVNPIATRGLHIDVLDTYNANGGLSGVEIFHDDAFTYANDTLNQVDSCSGTSASGSSQLVGDFQNPDVSGTTYLSVDVQNAAQSEAISVKLNPNITRAGNYSVTLYTPGCVQDGTCDRRGGVNVVVYAREQDEPKTLTLSQTNNYDKYEVLHTGLFDKPSDSFTPSVTIKPIINPEFPFRFVADRLETVLHSVAVKDSLTIRNLFEFDSANFTSLDKDSLPVGNTTINYAGALLNSSDSVNALFVEDNNIFVGGNFSGNGPLGAGMFKIGKDKPAAETLNDTGFSGQINGFQSFSQDRFIVFGNFSTDNKSIRNVAFYNIANDSWSPIQGGIDGEVTNANVLKIANQSLVGFSGNFTNVYTNSSLALTSKNSAFYFPDERSWFQESSLNQYYLKARLSQWTSYNNTMMYAGSVVWYDSASSGASFLKDDLSLSSTPYTFVPNPVMGNSTRLTSRNTILQSSENSVNAGAFANSTTMILAGHFSAKSQNSTFHNLLMVDSDSGQVTGLPNGTIDLTSTFQELFVQDNMLYAGGSITGQVANHQVSGLVFYDLKQGGYSSTQPPGLTGDQAVVTSVEVRPNTNDLVVAGSFEQAGGLACTSFCIFDLSSNRWKSPTPGLTGLVSSMAFIGNDVLILAGDLTLNSTNVFLAQYDFGTMQYTTFEGQSSTLPGPINSFVLNGNGVDSVFASGLDSSTGNAYVSHWNGTAWNSIDSVMKSGSVITKLVLLELATHHTENSVLAENQVLLMSGNIELDNFGNASGVFFDGTSYQAAYLTTTDDGQSGVINSFFSQQSKSFSLIPGQNHMRRGVVVVISMAIAFGLIFMLVGLGLLVAFIRRRREGYTAAPNRVSETEMAETIPPETLFEELNSSSRQPRRRVSGML